MRKIEVLLNGLTAGELYEHARDNYTFTYCDGYGGSPISRTMPVRQKDFHYDHFPSFFDGLLPEGQQLNYLLKSKKIDEHDYFSQLLEIGDDFVGAISIKEIN